MSSSLMELVIVYTFQFNPFSNLNKFLTFYHPLMLTFSPLFLYYGICRFTEGGTLVLIIIIQYNRNVKIILFIL